MALEATVSALTDLGRLDAIDSARVAIARGLAAAVDESPGNAALWREFRAAEEALREIRDTSDDELTQLESLLSAPLGDSEDAVP